MFFKKFSQYALDRLSVHDLKEIDLAGLWKKNEPFVVTPAISLIIIVFVFFISVDYLYYEDMPMICNVCILIPNGNALVQELIEPYWSLRATLGPVLETILLLDRLLFLQEQGNSLKVLMLPIFDPALSPRNVALISWKI